MRGSASGLGAALAMAEGTASVGSAGRADKATVAASKALRPWVSGTHYFMGSETRRRRGVEGD